MTSSLTTTRIPRTRWYRVLPVVFGMFTIAYMDRQNVAIALPAMTKDLHLPAAVAGILSGIPFLGYVATNVAAGPINNHFGLKRVVFVCLLLWGTFALLTGLAQDAIQVVACRFAIGLFEGPAWTAGTMLVARWFPEGERGRAAGAWNLAIPVGVILGSVVGGFLISRANWQVMFIVEAIPAFVWAIVWWFLVQEQPRDARWIPEREIRYIEEQTAAEQSRLGEATGRWQDVTKSSFVYVLIAGYACWSIGLFAFTAWLPSVLSAASKLGIANVGLLSSLPFVAGAVGMLVIQWSSDRRRERKLHAALPVGLMGVSLGAAVALLNVNFVLSMIFFVMFGLVMYGTFSVLFIIPTEVFPRAQAAVAIGVINGIGSIGGFVGPVLVGAVKGSTGSFVNALLVIAAICLLGCVLLVSMRLPRKERVQATPTRARPAG